MSNAWGIFEVHIFTLGFMILVSPADRSRANFQNIMCIDCTSDKGQCGQCCCFVADAAEAAATSAAAVFVVKYYVSWPVVLYAQWMLISLYFGLHCYKLQEQILICGRRRDYFLNHHVHTNSGATWVISKVNIAWSCTCSSIFFCFFLFCGLFCDIISNCIASDGKMFDGLVEGIWKWSWPNGCTTLGFSWRDWGKPWVPGYCHLCPNWIPCKCRMLVLHKVHTGTERMKCLLLCVFLNMCQ